MSMKAMKVWAPPQRRRQRSYSATWGPCVPALGRTADCRSGSTCLLGRRRVQRAATGGADDEQPGQAAALHAWSGMQATGRYARTLVVEFVVYKALVHKVLHRILHVAMGRK